MSNTFDENVWIRKNADALKQQEEDDDKAIAGLFVLIAGFGLAVLIGIAIVGAWAQFDMTEFLKTIF